MLDKALSTVVGATLACAAAALAAIYAAYALHLFLAPFLGEAGAAAAVAAAAAALVGLAGFIYRARAKAREEERARLQAAAQGELIGLIPDPLRALLHKHPIAAISVTVIAGVLAARNPRIVREVIAALRSAPRD